MNIFNLGYLPIRPLPIFSLWGYVRRWWSMCCVLLCTGASLAAYADEEVFYLGLDDGLSSRDINVMVQDKRGMLWVGTSTGLNYFDGSQLRLLSGTSFDASSFPSYNILDLAEDEAGNLWICTSSGAVALNPQRNRLMSLSRLGIPDSIARHPDFQVEAHPDGGFWVFAGRMLYRHQSKGTQYTLQPLSMHPLPVQGTVKMAASKRMQLWFYSGIEGLFVWERNAFHFIRNTNPVPPFQYKNKWNNNPFTTGMSVSNSLGDSLTFFFFSDSWRTVALHSSTQSIDTCSYGAPMYFQLPAWAAVVGYVTRNPGLFGNTLPSLEHIVIDQKGATWFATNLGIFVVNPHRIKRFQIIDFLRRQSIRGIYQDDEGTWWFGAYNGLYKHIPGREPVAYPDKKAVWSFAPSGKNMLWLATETPHGLVQLNTLNGSASSKFLPQEYSIYAAVRSGNTLWAGGNLPEVWALDALSGRQLLQVPLQTTPEAFRRPVVKTLLYSRDSSLWAAGESGLFCIRKDTSGTWRQVMNAVPAPLKDMPINALYEDVRGHLWIASKSQGLVRFTPATKQMQWYSKSDGLAHFITYSILGSHSDSLLWIGTQKGLSCLNVLEGYFNNYYETDGLAHNEFNTAAAYRARNGDLYFGGLSGATYFTPFIPDQLDHSTSLYVALRMPKRSDMATYPSAGECIRVQAWESFFEVQFHSNELFHGGEVSYRYKLSQAIDTWQLANPTDKIILANLSAGRHTLVAQARSPYSNWGPEFILYLDVSPPWYRTWQFFILVALLVSAAAYALFRLRIAQIEREYELRKQVSNDLHDDLGSRLFAMRNLARRIAMLRYDDPNTRPTAEQLDALSMDTLRSIRNFIWAFDPANDKLKDLVARMEDFADTAIRPLTPALDFQSAQLPDSIRIKPLVKHHLLLAYQEILTNMSKHTRPDKISVHIYMEGMALVVRISNICNAAPEKPEDSGGAGLESIASRMRAVHGKIEWSEKDGVQLAILILPGVGKGR